MTKRLQSISLNNTKIVAFDKTKDVSIVISKTLARYLFGVTDSVGIQDWMKAVVLRDEERWKKYLTAVVEIESHLGSDDEPDV